MGNQSVPHGIEVNIIKMGAIIVVVADRMFPEPSLPNSPLALSPPACGTEIALRYLLGKCRFNRLPPPGEIRITLRQGPKAMQMVRQYHPGVDMKRHPCPHLTHRLAQNINIPGQNLASTIIKVDREKIRSPWNPVTSIICHSGNSLDKPNLINAHKK